MGRLLNLLFKEKREDIHKTKVYIIASTFKKKLLVLNIVHWIELLLFYGNFV